MSLRSTIAGATLLVVLLTAGAAQSLSGSNTVTSDDIVDFSIVATDIKTAAIGGRPIVDNSITGTDINESSLNLRVPVTTVTSFTSAGCVPFGNGFAAPAYWRDGTGEVHLSGKVGWTGGEGCAGTMFVLPAGFRPAGTESFAVNCTSSNDRCRIDIGPDGSVEVLTPSGHDVLSIEDVSLSGVTFLATQ